MYKRQGRIFDYSGDKARNIAQIKNYNEADAEGYERYLKASEERYKVGFEGLVDKPFDSLLALFKFMPQLIRLRADRSVYKLVSRYIRDPQLRMTMSFHPLLIGGNPFSVTSVYTLISFLEQPPTFTHVGMGRHDLVVVTHVGSRPQGPTGRSPWRRRSLPACRLRDGCPRRRGISP